MQLPATLLWLANSPATDTPDAGLHAAVVESNHPAGHDAAGYPRPAPWSLLRAGRTPPQRREEEYTIENVKGDFEAKDTEFLNTCAIIRPMGPRISERVMSGKLAILPSEVEPLTHVYGISPGTL
jgi:hypothetical protein